MGLGRKQRRAALLVGALAVMGVATGLVLFALRDAIVFFYTPSEVSAKGIGPGQRFRLGGLVAQGSVKRLVEPTVVFAITDLEKTMPVSYKGQLPDLFREGQGVVAEGVLDAHGLFLADTVLAKHDENYMPKEVAEALKAKGVWRESGVEVEGPSNSGPAASPEVPGATTLPAGATLKKLHEAARSR